MFYSGSTKDYLGIYCVLIMSDNDGVTWTEPIAAAYDGEDTRCYDPCIWTDPLGRLWFFWAVMPKHAVWASLCNDPDACKLAWSAPFKIGSDVMMNKPTVLTTGEWLFPIAVWNENVYINKELKTRSKDKRSLVYRTIDNGKSFRKIGGAEVPCRSFDEHMILELKNGILMMCVRTTKGIGRSFSYDGGYSWTPGISHWLSGPCTRFFIRRLSSGNVLLVNHYKFKGRNNLTAMISDDECETWKGFLMIDERDDVSYPDAVESEEGYIYIIYDHKRGSYLDSLEKVMKCEREILMAKITEEDILSGKPVKPQSRLMCIVSKLGKYNGSVRNPYSAHIMYSLDEYVNNLLEIERPEEIVDKIFIDYGRLCLSFNQEDTDNLDKLVENLIGEAGKGNTDGKSHIIREIVNTLRQAYVSKNDDKDASDYLQERILKIIQRDIKREVFQLADVASELKISKYYMCHLFKRKTNTSIINYRNSIRISFAKRLLISTDLPITDICMQTGFKDCSYFTKWFHKCESITPLNYRKLNKKPVENNGNNSLNL